MTAPCSPTEPAVLGIDAAWTEKNPSGVALVRRCEGTWHCVALAPSYESFERLAEGTPVSWSSPERGTKPDVPRLLAAAHALLGGALPVVVAVDMPLSLETITERRESDSAISRAFGAMGASTHSPSAKRPGPIAEHLRDAFAEFEFKLAVDPNVRPERALIEVYPHPALIRLTGAEYRLPYKVARRGNTIEQVRCAWGKVCATLGKKIRGIELRGWEQLTSRTRLKSYEDALDACVCAWVGIEYVEGRAEAFGDHESAIWVPTA